MHLRHLMVEGDPLGRRALVRGEDPIGDDRPDGVAPDVRLLLQAHRQDYRGELGGGGDVKAAEEDGAVLGEEGVEEEVAVGGHPGGGGREGGRGGTRYAEREGGTGYGRLLLLWVWGWGRWFQS